jgi:hypothetical protein
LRRFERDPSKPYGVFLDSDKELGTSLLVVESALHATRALLGVEKAAKIFSERLGRDQQSTDDLVQAARRQEDLGFPLVYGQFAIVAWSQLEMYLRSTCIAWLGGPASVWVGRGIATVKIELDKYETMRAQQRVGQFLFDLVQQDVKSGATRIAIERWDSILKRIGLRAKLARSWRDDVRELCLVRNLFAHSPGGSVDERFLGAWPKRWEERWPGLSLGQPLPIKIGDALSYSRGTFEFARATNKLLNAKLKQLAESEKLPERRPASVLELLAGSPTLDGDD